MDRRTVWNMYSFNSKNKFEKLVHLVGFIIRIYARDWYSAVMNNYVITVPRLVTLCGRVVFNFQNKYDSTFV